MWQTMEGLNYNKFRGPGEVPHPRVPARTFLQPDGYHWNPSQGSQSVERIPAICIRQASSTVGAPPGRRSWGDRAGLLRRCLPLASTTGFTQ